jgi:hypothetical protein
MFNSTPRVLGVFEHELNEYKSVQVTRIVHDFYDSDPTRGMGNDPATSVVDRYHRIHDVSNLFVCDGSSLVTSGRGQPTMTIQALAFRAGEHITRFAKRGEI